MFRWGQSKLYWNRGNAFTLMSCHSNHCCISAYQQWTSPCAASCFDDVSANLEYLCLGSFQSCWIQVIDWNNASMIIGAAPISAQIISWGTDALYYSLIDDFLEFFYCDIIKLHILAPSPHSYLCLPKILYSSMESELCWLRLFFFTRFTELNPWAAQRAVPVRTNVEISHSVKTRKSKLLR